MLKRWFNIVMGKSTAAVEQGIGKCYSKSEVMGYYNDLTNKVTPNTMLDDDGVPYNLMSSGKKVYALVTISQYALGCYDLYLLNGDLQMRARFLKLAEYLRVRQEESGKWDARASMGSYKDNSSCMAQGQGCSIMLRAYLESHDEAFLVCAGKAIRFMMSDAKNGGTRLLDNGRLTYEKYPIENGKASTVLNGWAFALFGLFDYYLVTTSDEIRQEFDASCKTLADIISEYDCGFWSRYDLIGTIASPAYHDLHIALLTALGDLSGQQRLTEYAEKFRKYQKNPLFVASAVAWKAVQKMLGDSDAFIVQ